MQFQEVIIKRKSIRSFKKEKIQDKHLKAILYAANSAPISQKDYSSIQLTVIQDDTTLSWLQDMAHMNHHTFYDAPCIILVSSTTSAIPHISALNVGGIIQNMLLAATNEQLGSIYLTYFLTQIDDIEKVRRHLKISDAHTPIAAIGIGYSNNTSTFSITKEDVMNRILIHNIP